MNHTHTPASKFILATAWLVMLSVALHKIILQELFHLPVSADLQTGISVLIIAIGFTLTLLFKDLRPLRPFFGLFLVVICAEWLVYNRVDNLPFYTAWLRNPAFSVMMPAEKSLGLIVALIVSVFLLMVKKDRRAFFLTRGAIAAPVEPVRWLGIKPGLKWTALGRSFAIYLSLGTLIFLLLAGRPSWSVVGRAVPFLPAILIAAALNAFNEEITYKASFLSVLEDALGRGQALWLMAAYFGIFHYYGVPYGIIGVLLAGFLGWFLGKSMLETRGMFWAWFLHFLQDVFIFIFMAAGSITPGG